MVVYLNVDWFEGEGVVDLALGFVVHSLVEDAGGLDYVFTRGDVVGSLHELLETLRRGLPDVAWHDVQVCSYALDLKGCAVHIRLKQIPDCSSL